MAEPKRQKKQRPLTWMQEKVLEQTPADGKWHRVPVVATNSVIRGLISRGLIEHRQTDPNSIWEWIVSGQIRRVFNG